jgi:glycosyltransferase involved in cell wall biosynthesis
MMRTVAIIPAYNAQRTIGMVVSLTKKFADKVIVVDNNSGDNTVSEALISGAIVYHQITQGAGAATRKGWHALRWNDYYDAFITLDSDGQHIPEEIPKLVKPILNNEADVVIGCRLLEDKGVTKLREMGMIKVPRYRRFGIWVITTLYNIGHKPILDSQSCFRAFSRKAINSLSIEDDGFGFSTEMLIKARKLGLRIVEVPITCIYHSSFYKNSTMNPIKHGLGVALRTIYWRIKLWN